MGRGSGQGLLICSVIMMGLCDFDVIPALSFLSAVHCYLKVLVNILGTLEKFSLFNSGNLR